MTDQKKKGTNVRWPEAPELLLRKRWGENISADNIAEELGAGFTKSSVINKAKRLGLPSRGLEHTKNRRPQKDSVWTKERVALLKTRWCELVPSEDIANELACGLSDIAVAMKALRLGLPSRDLKPIVRGPRKPQKPRTDSVWTAERVSLLRKLWEEGVDEEKIVAELGGVMNVPSVRKKRERLGLPRRESRRGPHKPRPPKPYITIGRIPRPPKIGKRGRCNEAPPTVLFAVPELEDDEQFEEEEFLTEFRRQANRY